MYKNGLNMVFPLQVRAKKKKGLWSWNSLSDKGKFQVQQSVKKVILSVLWAKKWPIIIDFIGKGSNYKQYFLLPTR